MVPGAWQRWASTKSSLCPQNHLWPLQSAPPVPQHAKGHSQAAVASPEPNSPFPGHCFGLAGTFQLLWVSWRSHRAQPELHARPGMFFLLRSKRPLQREGVKGRVCAWGAPTERFGEQKSLRWGRRAPPTSAPQRCHSSHPYCDTGDQRLGTLHEKRIPVQTPGDARAGSCTRKDVRNASAGRPRGLAGLFALQMRKVPVAGGALSVSHLVPYRGTDLRCGWVSQVSGHQGKQF